VSEIYDIALLLSFESSDPDRAPRKNPNVIINPRYPTNGICGQCRFFVRALGVCRVKQACWCHRFSARGSTPGESFPGACPTAITLRDVAINIVLLQQQGVLCAPCKLKSFYV